MLTLDDLFKKTTNKPWIYWLPLTGEGRGGSRRVPLGGARMPPLGSSCNAANCVALVRLQTLRWRRRSKRRCRKLPQRRRPQRQPPLKTALLLRPELSWADGVPTVASPADTPTTLTAAVRAGLPTWVCNLQKVLATASVIYKGRRATRGQNRKSRQELVELRLSRSSRSTVAWYCNPASAVVCCTQLRSGSEEGQRETAIAQSIREQPA